ncbi:unnamed protein product [Pleuronectes platessa]|uniref:Uncharacterized protein n=1 Tax=Pleuronectes platessa TaxID=8262 RepID=A0A9N7UU92_PLEPL|nr:unnamed protein product [Pleuronectes platessa]
MPRVEELEPWNVPRRPLQREAQREGGARRDKGTGLRWFRHCTVSAYVRVGGEEGTIIHPCQSHPLSQSTPATSATSATPTPPQALWQRSGLEFRRLLLSVPLCPAPPCPAPPCPAPPCPAPCVTFFVL